MSVNPWAGPVRFPGESDAYRAARDELTKAELELRKKVEEVAALRRALPIGGVIPEDYRFEEEQRVPGGGGTREGVHLSSLFAAGKDSLILYSYMFSEDMAAPCPMCTSFLDSVDATAPHLTQNVNLAIVAKSPPERLAAFARERGWRNLRLLSSAANTFNADYHAESPEMQLPALHVFVKRDDGVHHFYTTEVLYAPMSENTRHIDQMWPLWNFLDLVPEGRGSGWYPRLEYDG